MLNVYLVQMESKPGNQEDNLNCAASLVESANPIKGSLILFPEMFATGYIPKECQKYKESYDATAPGTVAKFLRDLAGKTNCTIIGGGMMSCLDASGKEHIYNHLGIFSPDAESEIAGYNKVHPFFPEQDEFTAGDKITLSKIQNFNVAPSICYDLRFPELYRDFVRNGASLITVQAAWPKARREHWKTLLKARAIENQSYVAAVNCVTADGEYSGDSQIISPTGEVLVKAESGKNCVVSAEISSELVAKIRMDFPVLKF